jgi:hypothetical protein
MCLLLQRVGMDSEKVGVLEAGQTVGLALKRQNNAGVTRCKLVLPSNGVVCWYATSRCFELMELSGAFD